MPDLRTAAQQALAEPDIDPVDEYRKGFIDGQIDMRDRPEELAEPVLEPVAQISANRAIAAIEEWKSLWRKVPPFASKVNRATREAITVSHNPLFALLLDAQAAKQMPKGCTTPSGCQQHGCHGECLPTEPQRPAEPVQEAVAWMDEDINCAYTPEELDGGSADGLMPLYTHPPQRKPLTEEELDALAIDEDGLPNSHIEFARAIERAHGIKE